MKEKDFWVFEYLIRAGVFILILLLVLALITSAVTGISMFDPAIFKMLTDIFKIALVLLGLLIVLPFIVIIFFKKG